MSAESLRAALMSAQVAADESARQARALARDLDGLSARILSDLKSHDTGSRRLPEGGESGDFGWHDDPERN